MHKLIKIAPPIVLGIALLLSIAWAVYAPDFEPVITTLVLLVTLIAIFADRWLAEREKRKETLRVLAHELYMNIHIMNDLHSFKLPEKVNSPHIYPRYYTSSLNTAISSGLFTSPNDTKLWKLMNGWLQRAQDFNNRLNISEIHVFSNPSVVERVNRKVSEGLNSLETATTLRDLLNYLMSNYSTETQIDHDTVLFPDD